MAHCNVDLQVIAQDSPLRQPQGPIWHRQAPHLGHLCVRSKNASMLPGHLCRCRYAIANSPQWRHLCAHPYLLIWPPTKPLILLSTTLCCASTSLCLTFQYSAKYNLNSQTLPEAEQALDINSKTWVRTRDSWVLQKQGIVKLIKSISRNHFRPTFESQNMSPVEGLGKCKCDWW